MLGPGIFQIMIAVGVTQIPIFARLMRGSVLAQRDNDFVLAARAIENLSYCVGVNRVGEDGNVQLFMGNVEIPLDDVISVNAPAAAANGACANP